MGDGGGHVPFCIVYELPLIDKTITITNLCLMFFLRLFNEDRNPWVELGNGVRTNFFII